MKNKGFTLIELLSVIVILVIIALIATPIIIGVIEKTKRSAAERSIFNFVQSVEDKILLNAFKNEGLNYDGNYSVDGFTLSDKNSEKLKELKLNLKGSKPTDSNDNVIIENNSVIYAQLTFNGYKITYKNDDGKITYCLSENEFYPICDISEEEIAILKASSGKDDVSDFRIFNDKIKNITIKKQSEIPNNYIYSYDISEKQNGDIMAYLLSNTDDNEYYDLIIQSEKNIFGNKDMSYWFYNMVNVDSLVGMNLINTANVYKMKYLFKNLGQNSLNFTLNLGDNFDTSKVTDMSDMFNSTGENSLSFTLSLGNKFDTSNVTDMNEMFSGTGKNSKIFTLDLKDKFNTINVTDMSYMFYHTGENSQQFTLDLKDKFNTINVTNMSSMFSNTGSYSESFTLNLGNKFDTSNVIDMSNMFYLTGLSSKLFTLDLGDKFNTSNVVNMSKMFNYTGSNNKIFTLNLGNKFNTRKVTNMSSMFKSTGKDSEVFTLNLGNEFDTRSVTNMSEMFKSAGKSNKDFTLNLGDKFDTSNVVNMSNMFYSTGYESNKMNVELTIKNPFLTEYTDIFNSTARNGSKITISYTSETSSLVDSMILTKSNDSNVIKGILLE